MSEEIRKAFEEIENYNPCYTGHRVTLKSCFKRARLLSKEDSHSGLICNNQDAAKVVFLCKILSDIKAGAESVQEDSAIKDNIICGLEDDKANLCSLVDELKKEIQQLKVDCEMQAAMLSELEDENKDLRADKQELKGFIVGIAQSLCAWAERKDEPSLYEIIDKMEEQFGEEWGELLIKYKEPTL